MSKLNIIGKMKSAFFTSISLSAIGFNSILGTYIPSGSLIRRSYADSTTASQSKGGNGYGKEVASSEPVEIGSFNGNAEAVSPPIDIKPSEKSYGNKGEAKEVAASPYSPANPSTENVTEGNQTGSELESDNTFKFR
ncbi:hypothetical protein DSO57_1013386 [Entomophthora muscae]|uniref:Uncharacterized protein n=1 Tax=Entomophthora muscae TaxID=34485 RepID=A0ACC2S7N5_9FUNG|nr:hypothetical protein DSO57_1013386 [Entomophthora muscae]